MKHLTKYVDQLNFANRLFKKPLLDANKLSRTEIDHICARLNSDFSPENVVVHEVISPENLAINTGKIENIKICRRIFNLAAV